MYGVNKIYIINMIFASNWKTWTDSDENFHLYYKWASIDVM